MPAHNAFSRWFSGKNKLFPVGDERTKAFADAKIYFDENPNATKFRRKDKRNGKNSFIKGDDNKIYMLAHDSDINESYLGHGTYASVKKALDEDGNLVAVRIEYLGSAIVGKEIGLKTKLVITSTTNKSDSKKPLGKERFQPSEKDGGYAEEKHQMQKSDKKEYQIQKLAGIPLNDFMEIKGPLLSGDERLRLAIRIITAVAALHKTNIAHLDLKQENICINPITQEVTIIDFGLSAMNPEATFLSENSEENLIVAALKAKPRGSVSHLPRLKEALSIRFKHLDIHALIKSLYFPKGQIECLDGVQDIVEVIKKSFKKDLHKLSVLPESIKQILYTEEKTEKKLEYSTPRHFDSCLTLALTVISANPQSTTLVVPDNNAPPKDQMDFLKSFDTKISTKIKSTFETNFKGNVMTGITTYQAQQKGVLGLLFHSTGKTRAKNYKSIMTAATTSLQMLAITYALLCTKNGTDLKKTVANALGLDQHEAKYHVHNLLRDEIKTKLSPNNENKILTPEELKKLEEEIDQIIYKIQDDVTSPIIKLAIKNGHYIHAGNQGAFTDPLSKLAMIETNLSQSAAPALETQ